MSARKDDTWIGRSRGRLSTASRRRPQPPVARPPEEPAVDHDGQPSTGATSPAPARAAGPRRAGAAAGPPRGDPRRALAARRRGHRRRRRLGGGRRGAGDLADLVGEAGAGPGPRRRAAATTAEGGPTSRHLDRGVRNLVVNWSFEQDLNGWQVLGVADGGREPQGRTFGSCASVRSRGPEPGRVGLACPGRPDGRGGRALCGLGLGAFQRRRPAGDRRLAGGGGRGLEDDRGDAARPGMAAGHCRRHRRHRRPARLEIVADGVPPATRCWSTRSLSDRDNPGALRRSVP